MRDGIVPLPEVRDQARALKETIFKIQMPVESTIPDAPALVYNRDRTVERFIQVDQGLVDFMRGESKKFAFGHVDLLTRKLILVEEAPWQGW